MSNSNLTTFANAGVPRELTLELLRDMRIWLYRAIHEQPDQIRCCALRKVLDEHVMKGDIDGGGPIPVVVDASIPPNQLHFYRGVQLVGVIKDLGYPYNTLQATGGTGGAGGAGTGAAGGGAGG